MFYAPRTFSCERNADENGRKVAEIHLRKAAIMRTIACYACSPARCNYAQTSYARYYSAACRKLEASSSTAVWRTRNGEDLSEHEWACELEPRAVAGARASTNAQRLRPSGNYWPAKKRVIGAFSEVDLVAGMVYCSRSSRVSWIDTSSCRQLAAITRIPRNYGTVCVHARIIWILHRPNYFSHAGYIFTCVCLSVCLSVCLFGC